MPDADEEKRKPAGTDKSTLEILLNTYYGIHPKRTHFVANSRWLELTMETGNFLVDFFLNFFIKISVVLVYAYLKKYDAPWEERRRKTLWKQQEDDMEDF